MTANLPFPVGIIHFVGIGGIGMSGIAEVLHNLGHQVRGSDQTDNYNVQRLIKLGIPCSIGHVGKNVEGAALVVVSSAVKADNPEFIAARELHIPIVKRAEMLGELMRLKSSIAVGGTHGKTTTTSMIATLLHGAGLDPTVINGGIINSFGTNARLGEGDWMVVESDESDGSFTKLPATAVVVTNIDPEHMEHYGSFDAVRDAYHDFVQNIPFFGFAALCIDHPEVQALISKVTERRIITYGLSAQADVRAFNIQPDKNGARFDVSFNELAGKGKTSIITGLYLPMLGEHNIQNATSAILIARELGIQPDVIKSTLNKFTGVKRRFTKTGEAYGVQIIDDYGHHPVEINAVLKSARQAVGKGRVVAVVQPHRYSRLSSLFNEFCTCFNDADIVLVADVYAAGEKPIDGFNRDSLVEGLRNHGHRHVLPLSSPEDLPRMAYELTEAGDLVICLGAGTISNWANALPEQLKAITDVKRKAGGVV